MKKNRVKPRNIAKKYEKIKKRTLKIKKAFKPCLRVYLTSFRLPDNSFILIFLILYLDIFTSSYMSFYIADNKLFEWITLLILTLIINIKNRRKKKYSMGPWPSLDKASAFYLEMKIAEDPGFNSPRAR